MTVVWLMSNTYAADHPILWRLPMFRKPHRADSRKPLNLYGEKWTVQLFQNQIFLRSGCREREVKFATWADIHFAEYDDEKSPDEQDASTYTVNEKPAMGFTIKNHKSREIPISDDLVEALKTYQVLYPNRKTIFVNKDGGPEGHFLGKLKAIVKRANLPGEWSLHKFRRTFATNALANGVPIHVVQEWLGHCYLTTLKRYAAKIEMKKPQYRNYANRVARAVKV